LTMTSLEKNCNESNYYLFDAADDDHVDDHEAVGPHFYPYLDEARALCETCPAKRVCREVWGKKATHGIWGGEPK
jgi:hypothetical protein